jgi:hypothetical protein
LRKEVICYVATNEEDVEVSIQRVSNDTDYILLRLGTFAIALDRKELSDALGTVTYYGNVFDQEKIMKDNAPALEASRAAAAKKATELASVSPGMKQKKTTKVNKEDEGALIIEVENRKGPTDSEIKLAAMMAGLGTFKNPTEG